MLVFRLNIYRNKVFHNIVLSLVLNLEEKKKAKKPTVPHRSFLTI